MNQNPYSEPDSDVTPPIEAGELVVAAPESRPIGHGWRWYTSAWEIFRADWGMWLATILLLFVIMFGLQMVPFIGWVASTLLTPVLSGGLMLMAQRASEGRGVELGDLFAGFRERTGPLMAIGAINLAATLVIVLVMLGPMFSSMGDLSSMQGMSEEEMSRAMMEQGMGAGSMLMVLLGLALMIPWLAAIWFSVPLIFLGERGVGAALKQSLVGCLKNILPFLWYGILYFLLAIVATIPLGLGWFVLLPVLMLSMYTAFRDIYMGGLD